MSDNASKPIFSVQHQALQSARMRRWSPGSLLGLLRIVGRRLWSHLWLMLAIAAGFVVAIALVVAIPVYAEAALTTPAVRCAWFSRAAARCSSAGTTSSTTASAAATWTAVGTVSLLDCDALTVEGSALRLIVYTATPGSRDADTLRLLAAVGLQSFS